MDNITQQSYNKEIRDLATCLVEEAYRDYNDIETREEAEESLNDMLLHEAIDDHQWIIYYYGNDKVLEFTDNYDAYKDVYSDEDLGALVADKGLEGAKTAIAYFAMYQDVSELLEAALDKWDEDHEDDSK